MVIPLNKEEVVVRLTSARTSAVSCSLQPINDCEPSERFLELYPQKKLKSETMLLKDAKEKAIKVTAKSKKVVFIDFVGDGEDEGECELTSTQNEQSIHAFSNGAEIPLPPLALSKEKIKEQKQNEKVMAKKEKAKGKAAKAAAKEKPAKKSAAKSTEVKGKQKDITVKEIIALLKKGVGVYTLGGTKHSLPYNEKVADKSTVRTVIVGE